ncbi:helix-turn-helix transcriptional regulator, partial [Pectobacterium jejuense]
MLSEKIRELRTSCGLSLEQLAVLVGSTKSYIWEL